MNALIAYFSYTGHTKGIAQQIRDITGGTLFEIRPATPYDQDYNTTERQGYNDFTGKMIILFVTDGGPDAKNKVMNWLKKLAEKERSVNVHTLPAVGCSLQLEVF